MASPDDPPFLPYEGDRPFLFVSYAHADRRRVFEEIGRLHGLGYRIWYDRGIRVGEEWPDAIASALGRCSMFLPFLSTAAAASRNVRDEIHFAIDHGKPIVAVHLEEGAMTAGLRLRLGSVQAILRHELSEADYRARLAEALPASLIEPPGPTGRPRCGSTLGVDFGTTNSVMAIWTGSGLQVLPNREGERSTPSVVAWYPGGDWLVGDAAVAQAHRNYENTFFSFKTKLGTDFAVDRGGRRYRARDLAAMVLSKLRQDAALQLGFLPRGAVATHPVRFTHAQKGELIRAFESAGFEVARLIPEPTAVALAYTPGREDLNKIAIFDLGGGSFDVSILDLVEGTAECLAVDGDAHLGGDDFDRALADHCLDRFEREHGIEARGDPAIDRRVLGESERVKKVLSGAPRAHVELPYLKFHDDRWWHLDLSVSSEQYRELTGPLVDRAIGRCAAALEAARLGVDQLDHVLLAGLATRMPGLRDEVRRFFGREPTCRVDPAEAVALGAAIQGAILEGNEASTLLLDVVASSLGLELASGACLKIVGRNTTIPTAKVEDFRAPGCPGLGVNLNLFEGERLMALDNRYLGSIRLESRSGWTDDDRFRVEIQVESNHDIAISIKHLESGHEVARTISLAGPVDGRDPATRPASNLAEVPIESPRNP